MGGNPAENHPVGFKWFLEARKTRGAKIVAVDPRFTRTAAVADFYAPVRAGSDIAFLLGIIRYAIETNRFHEAYVKLHTSASLLINPAYAFDEGLFSGFDDKAGTYAKDSWTYQLDAKGMAMSDPTLQDPQCVLQLLKKHVSRYTPETVERICGTPKDAFLKVCEIVTSTGNAERCGTITYALGWTQHSTGVQMIRAAAILQLLLGNVGRPGGGVNAFRGHSNIQGATDMAGTFDILPGYLKTPAAQWTSLKEYIEANTPKPLGPSMNYWQNYDKFIVSLLKAAYGKAATKENDFGYEWLPKIDGNYSWMYICDDMYRGNATRAGGKEPGPEGFISFGMNPVGTGPELARNGSRRSRSSSGSSSSKTSRRRPPSSGRLPGSMTGPRHPRSRPRSSCFPPPTSPRRTARSPTPRAGSSGSGRRSIRRARRSPTRKSCRAVFLAVRDLYKKEGGALPEAVTNVVVGLHEPGGARSRRRPQGDQRQGPRRHPGPQGQDEGLEDGRPAGRRLRPAPGRRLDDVRQLAPLRRLHGGRATTPSDASTTDPTGLGMYHNWAFSWPANRRVMYNRASADADGKPWDPKRPGIVWNGEKWVGDVPDMKPDAPPGEFGAFIMLPEGVGRLFSAPLNDGPFPEHYEAVEAPIDNLLHPKVTSNPTSKKFSSDKDVYGKRERFPDRLHHLPADRALPLLDAAPARRRAERAAARLLRRDPGGLSRRRRASPTDRAQGQLGARLHRGSRHGHQAPAAPARSTASRMWQIGFPIHWGYAGDPEPHGAARQPPHALRHGPEHVDARVQVVPRQAREGVRRRPMSTQSLEIRRSSASVWGSLSGHPHGDAGLQVHRHDDLHRLQGLRGRRAIEWNDLRHVATQQIGSYQTLPTLHAEYWNLIRFNERDFDGGLVWLMRKDQCMHCDGAGLPGGLSGARRHRAVRQRHRGRQPRPVHRLRLLRDRMPLRRARVSTRRPARWPSAPSVSTASRWASSRPASRPARRAACSSARRTTWSPSDGIASTS